MLKFVEEIYGFKSSPDPEAAYLRAKASLSTKSKRAKEIIAVVEQSQHVIEVVIGSSVGQDSAFRGAIDAEPVSKLVWDPGVAFPILVDASQVSTTSTFMGKPRTTTKTVAKLAPLPAEIVLIHELGHAAQYLGELPTYVALMKGGSVPAIEADNLDRNEWPICDDYGLRKRSSYLHYNGSAETSRWSIT